MRNFLLIIQYHILKNAGDTLKNINWTEYEHVVFVAKSLGTVVACKVKEIKCHIEQGVGHRMEVMNDLQRNLEIVFNVIRHLN